MSGRVALRLLGHQEYLRQGVRDRIIRLFHDPKEPRNESFEVDFFGYRYPGSFNNYIDWNVYYYGAYEKSELALIGDILANIDSPVVLDVGGNEGHHSLFMSRLSLIVHCFEPFQELLVKARERIQRNRIENIRIHEVALGQSSGRMPFYPSDTTNTGRGSFSPIDASRNPMNLPIRNGDAYLQELGVDRIDFIKIDVEGFERRVQSGLTMTLRTHRPICLLEWRQSQLCGNDKSGSVLFPEDYLFFHFRGHVPTFLLFQRPRYWLQGIRAAWPDGNILAIPDEWMGRLHSIIRD
jgi:FkbM family methyltransferase